MGDIHRSGNQEYLTPDPLIPFLNEVQRDPRLNEILFPFYDKPRVLQLFAKYEKNDENIKNGNSQGKVYSVLKFCLLFREVEFRRVY